MNIAAIVFGALALACVVIMVVASVLRDNSKIWKLIDPEALLVICLVLLMVFAIIAAYFCVDRCENCDRVVSNAYCEVCGAKNEKYEEPMPEVEKICPNCKVVVYAPFCGDCGAKINDGKE